MTANPYTSPENAVDLPARKSNLLRMAVRVLVVVGILAFLVALLLPATRTGGRKVIQGMQCANNLKQIALALQNYHDAYGGLPPAYTVNAAGKPLHSWRTLILPFIEGKPSYDKIDLSKPWNDPANQAAFDSMPPVYRCPSNHVSKGKTTYLAIVVPGACLKPTESRPMSSITDGTSQTLAVIEVSDEQAVHWMEPRDADEAVISNLFTAKTLPHPNVLMGAFVDGHVQALTRNTPPAVLQALISAAGDDVVGDF
jgi:prepilin-type processing-associated H-X9-DG protein